MLFYQNHQKEVYFVSFCIVMGWWNHTSSRMLRIERYSGIFFSTFLYELDLHNMWFQYLSNMAVIWFVWAENVCFYMGTFWKPLKSGKSTRYEVLRSTYYIIANTLAFPNWTEIACSFEDITDKNREIKIFSFGMCQAVIAFLSCRLEIFFSGVCPTPATRSILFLNLITFVSSQP